MLYSKSRFIPNSPAFLFRTEEIIGACRMLRSALRNSTTRILYAVKACAADTVLESLRGTVDGFAVSSPAEAQIASKYLRDSGDLQITTPGFKREWFEKLSGLTHVAFNSISQYERLRSVVTRSASIGIRLNPGRSSVEDKRYDPCRQYSKLGIPITDAEEWLKGSAASGVTGVHVHNACLCRSWQPLLETVERITSCLGPALSRMEWINLGGGYIWDENTDFHPLQESVDLLAMEYGLQVFLEPGAGLVNSAGYLVASVIDLIKSDGKMIAVLDTTVNHLPEVFEYQYEPDVVEHVDDAPNEYVLAGCSCLAGDLFGEYSFEQPLEIGSRVTFTNVGAYSLVKAHMFNGINLPTIYTVTEIGELTLTKQFTYEDFASRWRATDHALV